MKCERLESRRLLYSTPLWGTEGWDRDSAIILSDGRFVVSASGLEIGFASPGEASLTRVRVDPVTFRDESIDSIYRVGRKVMVMQTVYDDRQRKVWRSATLTDGKRFTKLPVPGSLAIHSPEFRILAEGIVAFGYDKQGKFKASAFDHDGTHLRAVDTSELGFSTFRSLQSDEFIGVGTTSDRFEFVRIDGLDSDQPVARAVSVPRMYDMVVDFPGKPLNGKWLLRSEGRYQLDALLWDGVSSEATRITGYTIDSYASAFYKGRYWFANGNGAWSTDGTAAGARSEASLPGANGRISAYQVVNDRLLFRREDSADVWSTDGTVNGTRRLLQVDNGYAGFKSSSQFLGVAGGRSLIRLDRSYDTAVQEGVFTTDGVSIEREDTLGAPVDMLVGRFGNEYVLTGYQKFYSYRPTNSPPQSRLEAAASWTEGTSLRLDASKSFDSDGDPIVAYQWDLDGNADFRDLKTSKPVLEISWADLVKFGVTSAPSSYRFRVRTADAETVGSTAGVTVRLVDAPPQLAMKADAQASVNVEAAVSWKVTDVGGSAVVSQTVDWGDGTAVQSVSGTIAHHQYTQPSLYTVTLRIGTRDHVVERIKKIRVIAPPVDGVRSNIVSPFAVSTGTHQTVEQLGRRTFVVTDSLRGNLFITDGTAAGTRLFEREVSAIERIGEMMVLFPLTGRTLRFTDGTIASRRSITLGTRHGVDGDTSFAEGQVLEWKGLLLAYDDWDIRLINRSSQAWTDTVLKDVTGDILSEARFESAPDDDVIYFTARSVRDLEYRLYSFDGQTARAVSQPLPATSDKIEPVTGGRAVLSQSTWYAIDPATKATRNVGAFARLLNSHSAGGSLVYFGGPSESEAALRLLTSATADPTVLTTLKYLNFKATNYRGKLYFTGEDGLYVSDGTISGTQRLYDAGEFAMFEFVPITGAGRYVYAGINQGGRSILIRTDGTSSGTFEIFSKPASGLSGITRLVPDGSTMQFIYTNDAGSVSYSTRGSRSTTVQVGDGSELFDPAPPQRRSTPWGDLIVTLRDDDVFVEFGALT